MLVFSKKSFKEFSAIKQGISDLVQPLVERMADWYIKMMKRIFLLTCIHKHIIS